MRISGNKLKLALKGNDLTQEEAAIKLGITRQKLSMMLNLEILGEDVIQNVKQKLGIDLEESRKGFSVAEDVKIAPFGDERWIDRNLSVIENLEKVINFKKEGLITEEEFVRIKGKILR